MALIEILSGLVRLLWQRGHIKHQEHDIEQLKLKRKFLDYMRDALKEEIMKELVRGKMPSREYHTWLHRGERIEHQINDMLDAQLKDSVIDTLTPEQSKHLVSLLENEIIKCLERSPFDHGPISDKPHKMMKKSTKRLERKLYRSFKKGQIVKSPAGAEKKATGKVKLAKSGSGISKPKKGQIHLVQKVEGDKATAEAHMQKEKYEKTDIPASSSSPSREATKADLISSMKGNLSTAEAEPKEVIHEPATNPDSPSSTRAAPEVEPEVEDVRTIVPTSPSISNTEATQADLILEAKGSMAAAELEPMEVEDEIMIVPTSQSIPRIEAAKATLSSSASKEVTKSEMVSSSIEKLDNFPAAGDGEIRVCDEEERPLSPKSRLNTKKSIQHMVQKLNRLIAETNTKIIGLYGQGGIGKTSILKAFIDHSEVRYMFDAIIYVTVSRCWSIKKIQNGVMSQLAINQADYQTDSERAKKLFRTLEKKKFLLILDDVWENIDLHAAGIPTSSLGKSCRLMLATRSLEVCHDMAAKEIEVGCLSKEEAWELFCEQAGQIVVSPNIQPYAQEIANECGRLPLHIIITARALTGENNVSVWKHALKDFLLAKTGNSDIDPQIQLLKFSYERLKIHVLKSETLMSCDIQNCFLYCALIPEDYEVYTSTLVDYWIEEGLLVGNADDARKKGHDIVQALIDAALLESIKHRTCIKMHDSIRDLASGILSAKVESCNFLGRTSPRLSQLPIQGSNSLSSLESVERYNIWRPVDHHEYLFRAGGRLAEPPPEKEWEPAKVMFLMDNELSSLPARPNCPNLLTLLLQRNFRLRVLPDSFFDLMPLLKVLNMSKTRITSLPKSISQLDNLKELYLRDCERLMKLPSEVGKLKHLQLLDLHGTVLYELTDAIGGLKSLRDLEVSFYGPVDHREYSKLSTKLIPDGTISKLTSLTNLSIVVFPGDHRWHDTTESVIKDVCDLKNLTSLRFYFPKVQQLQLFLQRSHSWKHNLLEKFNFIVGHDIKRMLSRVPHNVELDYNQQDRCLRLVNYKTIPEDAIMEVLARTTTFYLDHHLKIRSLSQLGIKNIIRLEFCIVRECPEIEYIVDGEELALPFLEHLSLYYLQKLQGIWKEQLPLGSFASLKCLCIHTCWQLKFVFTSSTSKHFRNLEKLVVEDCKAIKDIISVESDIKLDYVMLPKLKIMELRYLPNLVSIWKGPWPSLEHISFYHCPKLKNLHMDSVTEFRSSIKKIEAEKQWWDKLELGDSSLRDELQLQTCFFTLPEEDL